MFTDLKFIWGYIKELYHEKRESLKGINMDPNDDLYKVSDLEAYFQHNLTNPKIVLMNIGYKFNMTKNLLTYEEVLNIFEYVNNTNDFVALQNSLLGNSVLASNLNFETFAAFVSNRS